MIAPLRDLQQLVLEGVVATDLAADPLLARIANSLCQQVVASESVGAADLAALLRQGMLRCKLVHGEEGRLRVPIRAGWPDRAVWAQFRCKTVPVGSGELHVHPMPWQPTWLERAGWRIVEDAIAERLRRTDRRVPGDPHLHALVGWDKYVSPGQREAVRAAYLMKPGSTLVVNLPTGAGKSLAFQLPALSWARQAGLALVVVPTVALARDQEVRFGELYARCFSLRTPLPPLAYHGGLDDLTRRAIRHAVRQGTQPILFTSPESALGALRGPLLASAAAGRLRYFAVDEAHLVSQWGIQFRPEFQSLAGLRDALLAANPPELRLRTLLLSATLTQESLEALRVLFGREGLETVAEVALRPEPGLLVRPAEDQADQLRWLTEAVHFLPRPLILYTTIRDDATDWIRRLRAHGFRRVERVRGGDLSDAGGEDMLRRWRERELDVVVATSAFGLGVDQADVRTVVHACLPETVDRYYQEIGRGGRDGNASVALLVATPRDEETAQRMANKRVISVERGFERWEAMRWSSRARHVGGDLWILSLDDRPSDLSDPTDENASWNLRTLVLMAQARVLEFVAHSPPVIEREPGEDEQQFQLRLRKCQRIFEREVAIRVLDTRCNDRGHWDGVVAQRRGTMKRADQRVADQVAELRASHRPLVDLFRSVYTLSDPPVLAAPPGTEPELVTPSTSDASLSLELQRQLSTARDEAMRYWLTGPLPADGVRRGREASVFLRLLRLLVAHGVAELALPAYLVNQREWALLVAMAPHGALLRASADDDSLAKLTLPVPRLTVLTASQADAGSIAAAMSLDRPAHLIVVPSEARDPRHPVRRLLEMVPYMTLEDLLTRLET